MDTVIPCYWFDTTGNPDAVAKVREHEADIDRGKKSRCRSCEHIVTDDGQRIAVDNSHSHHKTNPNGVEYHFQCFGQAPGCDAYGVATAEHTWFTGYRWQIAVCNSCGEHLGWYFRGEASFYGLITARLIQDAERPG